MTGHSEIQKELITPSGRAVRCVYTNWRGETRVRRVKPLTVFWGSNKWHPEPQWLVSVMDLERAHSGPYRDFALNGIKPFDPANDPQPRMVLFKHGRDTKGHKIGQGYNLKRRVLEIRELDPETNDLRSPEVPGGRKRVYYVTGRGVRTSCWIDGWKRWAKTCDRAFWDGEKV